MRTLSGAERWRSAPSPGSAGYSPCRAGVVDRGVVLRYEVLRLIQFLFSLGLILAAFAGGLSLGWWRWGRIRRVPTGTAPGPATAPDAAAPRQDLFAPELDLTEQVLRPAGDHPDARTGLAVVPVAELPRITAPAASTPGTR